MAPVITHLSHLANSLASSEQLETSASQLDGIPADLEDSVRFHSAQLLQAAGILLRLPQELIAQAITILYRFWTGPDGGSLIEHDASAVAAAALYLTAKPSGHSISPRKLLTVFSYLDSIGTPYNTAKASTTLETWIFPENEYETSRNQLYTLEAQILQTLGFNTHVSLPHPLVINYLQTLDVFTLYAPKLTSNLTTRSLALLNTALFSPQKLYLTHQPFQLAVAAIYLAARQLHVKLPDTEWWEVFDVDREELGFLAVGLLSVEGWVAEEGRKWGGRKVPLTVDEVREELERRKTLEEREEGE